MSVVHDGSGSTRRLADGSTEEAGWLEVDGERVFQVTRVPAGEVTWRLIGISGEGRELAATPWRTLSVREKPAE